MPRPITITQILDTAINDDSYITVICTTSDDVDWTLHLEPRAAFNLVDALDKWVNPDGELHAEFRHLFMHVHEEEKS